MHANPWPSTWQKEVFELAFADAGGRVIERKRLSRKAFARVMEQRPPLRVPGAARDALEDGDNELPMALRHAWANSCSGWQDYRRT